MNMEQQSPKKTITIVDSDIVCDISNQSEFKALLTAESAKYLKDVKTGRCVFGFQSLVDAAEYKIVDLPASRNICDPISTKEDVTNSHPTTSYRYHPSAASNLDPLPQSPAYDAPKKTKTKHRFGFRQSLKKQQEYKRRRLRKRLQKASTCHTQGNEFYNQGKNGQALMSYQEALQIRLEILGRSNQSVADLNHNIGNVLSDQDKPDEALKMYEEALTIRLEIFSEKHPDIGTTLYLMAVVKQSQGDHDEAMMLYEEALAIQIESLGRSHEDVADTCNAMGSVMMDQSQWDRALPYLQKALEIRQENFGSSHPDVATTIIDIGSVLDHQGKRQEALQIFQEGLSIQLQCLGESHLDLAKTYDKIGNILDDEGKWGEALEAFRKAMSIRLVTLDSRHPDIAGCQQNIGVVLNNMGKSAEALEMHRQSLSIRLEALGSDHLDVGTTYCNIGDILHVYARMGALLQDQQKPEDALKEYSAAVSIQERVLGNNHFDNAALYESMGQIHASLGQHEKAMQLYQQVLAIRLEALGHGHEDTADAYYALGTELLALGAHDKAVSNLQQALAIRLEIDRHNKSVTDTTHRMGNALNNNQNKHNEAAAESCTEMLLKVPTFSENCNSTMDFSMGFCNSESPMTKIQEIYHPKSVADTTYRRGIVLNNNQNKHNEANAESCAEMLLKVPDFSENCNSTIDLFMAFWSVELSMMTKIQEMCRMLALIGNLIQEFARRIKILVFAILGLPQTTYKNLCTLELKDLRKNLKAGVATVFGGVLGNDVEKLAGKNLDQAMTTNKFTKGFGGWFGKK
ncbi:unnamed protein product [Cylindrotheca closterium]|uniref:Kinesin light chain n=1 Tax=Cylindrotheca closterium TaxID=2856 RepID=A0AAD2G184_9STRA|nr:unnamed protein product [Cylindrotheca closterium]